MPDRIRFVALALLAAASLSAGAAPPAAPTLVYPAGTTPTITPYFQWNVATGATSYELLVQNTQGVAGDFRFPASACGTYCYATPSAPACVGTTTCPFLQSGMTYAWFVRASNADGTSAWSAGNTILVEGPPTLLSPAEGSSTSTTPSFAWRTMDAVHDFLVIEDLQSSGFLDSPLSHACAPVAGTALQECSADPLAPLLAGHRYAWYVDNNLGRSATFHFTVEGPTPVPVAPVLFAPADRGFTSTTPRYDWQASFGATSYYLLVQNTEGVAVGRSVSPMEAGCAGGTTCSFTPPDALVYGKQYNAFVNASNASGTSAWSEGHAFRVMIGGTPSPVSPSGTVATSTPTFSWTSPLPGPYVLLVQGDAAPLIYESISPACTFSSDTYRCSYKPATSLPGGASYYWRVANGAGWSDSWIFTVPLPPGVVPATPVPASPLGTIPAGTPYIWRISGGATEYDVLVQNTTGVAGFRTVRASDACETSADCELDETFPLTPGVPYNWFVRARNAAGSSGWSGAMSITVTSGAPPAAPALVAPSGSVPPSPVFTWIPVAGATRYSLLVQNTTGIWGSMEVDAAAAGCGSGTCTAAATFTLPASSVFNWFVKAYGLGGPGPGAWGGPLVISTP
jgi:hypothetical protein